MVKTFYMDQVLDKCPKCLHAKWKGEPCHYLSCPLEGVSVEIVEPKKKIIVHKEVKPHIDFALHLCKNEISRKIYAELPSSMDVDKRIQAAYYLSRGYSPYYVKAHTNAKVTITRPLSEKYGVDYYKSSV